MSIDCVAVLRIPSLPEGVHADPRGDAWLVHTFQRFDGKPADEHAMDLRTLLGAALDAHADPRGILLFPDVAEPRGQSYDALVAELDHEEAVWAPRVGADHVPSRYTHPTTPRDEIVGQLIAKLGRDEAMALDFMAGVHHVGVFFGRSTDRSELDASLAKVEALLGLGAGARYESALDATMRAHERAQAEQAERMRALQERMAAGEPLLGTLDLDALVPGGIAGLVAQMLAGRDPRVAEVLAKPLGEITDADLAVLDELEPDLAASLRQARSSDDSLSS